MLSLDRRRLNAIANIIVMHEDSTKQIEEYNSSKVELRFVLLVYNWILILYIFSSNNSIFITRISISLKISSLEGIS